MEKIKKPHLFPILLIVIMNVFSRFTNSLILRTHAEMIHTFRLRPVRSGFGNVRTNVVHSWKDIPYQCVMRNRFALYNSAEESAGIVSRGKEREGIEVSTERTESVTSSPFKRGDAIKAKVIQFGPIGASVDIEGGKARGLIVQKEIAMFRKKRNGDDVVIGEVLDGFVERVRDDGKINVFLRPTNISSRIGEVKDLIMDALEGSPDGFIPVGDKSSPEDIDRYFHGVSKRDFKSAVGSLYKEGIAIPADHETIYIPLEKREQAAKEAAMMSSKSRSLGSAKTIFIGNLPPNVNEEILLRTIQKVLGKEKPVTSLRLARDPDGRPRGFAYLDLALENDVEPVINNLKGVEIGGRSLRIDWADPQKKLIQAQKNQNLEAESDPLSELIAEAPYINRKKDERGQLKGWVRDAQKSQKLPRLNQKVNDTWKPRDSPSNKEKFTLFFGNLAFHLNEMTLKEEIERFVGRNSVCNIRLATDRETGRKRGFGYVDFYIIQDANKVYDEMHGLIIAGRQVSIDEATR